MSRILRGLTLAVALLGASWLAAPARASEPGVMKVIDSAQIFSADGIDKARAKFEGTTFQSKTHLLVVTASEIPASRQAEFKGLKDTNDRSRFFENWAREEGRAKDRKGDVVALVYMDGKRYWTSVIADEQTDVFRSFSDSKAKNAARTFNVGMKNILDKKLAGDAAKKEADQSLVSMTTQIIEDLRDTSAPASSPRASGKVAAQAEGAHRGSGIMGWVCIGLSVLAGIWLVTALFRALMGGGGGGYGPGGYGGGGGGGFFPSLLGGMFGAAAGMWLYDSLTGGSHGHYGSDAAAADTGGDYGDTGDGNYDGGAAGGDGGGDWGGGGDDFGGGDWGGGGEFGGGGDW